MRGMREIVETIALMKTNRFPRPPFPYPIDMHGFGALAFGPHVLLTVGHALQGPVFVSPPGPNASRGAHGVLYGNIVDSCVESQYPTQYIHKSFFRGGTDLAILVHHDAPETETSLPRVLRLLQSTTFEHANPLTNWHRPGGSAFTPAFDRSVDIFDENYGPVPVSGTLRSSSSICEPLLIVGGLAYPGICGSMAAIGSQMIGIYSARMSYTPANEQQITEVCERVFESMSCTTIDAILTDHGFTLPCNLRANLIERSAALKAIEATQAGNKSIRKRFMPFIDPPSLGIPLKPIKTAHKNQEDVVVRGGAVLPLRPGEARTVFDEFFAVDPDANAPVR